MFYVTSLNGLQVEPLINISDDFNMEQSTDGSLTVSFSCFPSDKNAGYELLQSESILTVDGYDFKVKEYKNNTFSKEITATSTFFELAKKRKNDILGGTITLANRVAFVLSGTGWTYSIDTAVANKYALIANFGENNIINLINVICAEYDIEYIIERDNHVHFAHCVGGNNDYQYRYKYNVNDVVLAEDTTDLFTRIKGTGKDGLTVTYTSPNAAIFGILEAEPLINEDIDNATELGKWLAEQIQDAPLLAIESDTVELTNRNTGESVWLIYEPLGVEMQTRILSQTKVIVEGELITESVVLGNTVPKTSVDLMVEQSIKINENDKKYRSKFEQTNDRITLEVEEIGVSIAAIEIKSDQIQSSVTTLDGTLRSVITQTASSIRSELTSSITTVNGNISTLQNDVSSIRQTANSIQSTVSSQQTQISGQSTRLTQAESSITQHAKDISLRVMETDFNGNTIASKINQTATTIQLEASKINLNGAVLVNGSLTGSSNINITNNAYIGNNLYLGQHYSTTKRIVFNSACSIEGGAGPTGDDIALNGSLIEINGNIDASAIESVSGLVGSATDNLFLAYASSTKRLYVRVGGKSSAYDVGYIPLT